MALLKRYADPVRRHVCWTLFAAAAAGLFLATAALAQLSGDGKSDYSEYDIKAAYLVNFAKYVEWPAAAFPDEDSPFMIGILGANPFGDTLAGLARDQEVNGRRMVIAQSDELETLASCHILFTSGTPDLSALATSPTLTVGEQKGFTEMGGIVNFVIVETKVRFEISVKAARQHNLKVSSRLLKLATKVHQ